MTELPVLIESLELKRNKWLKFNLLGFIIWDGLRVIDKYLLVNQSLPVLTVVSLFGGFIWAFSLFQLIRIGNEMKNNNKLIQIMNDELVKVNRLKAWKFAFVAVLVVQIILILTSFLYNIPSVVGAEITIFIAVISAIGSFIYYQK